MSGRSPQSDSSLRIASRRTVVGARKCRTCHVKEPIGNQYDKWLEGKHAKAFDTLASEQSAKWAAEAGVTDPQTDEKCVKCHVTGSADLIVANEAVLNEGVQCEACHGPGRAHAAGAADDPPSTEGMTAQPGEKVCTTCHNPESPHFKDFFFRALVGFVHRVP